MKKLLIKFSSEITLKGLNRKNFEDALVKNIRERIGKEYTVQKGSGRLFIGDCSHELIDKVTKVFGVLSVAPADVVEKDIDKIGAAAVEQLKEIEGIKTFKVESKRADKNFPLNSMELSRKIGGIILRNIPDIRVDVHNPDVVVNVEIRDMAYVYSKEYKGVAGMPYRTSGKGVLLLSGGIDSPVAGYMMAKRGLEIISVYYHSHPYTSERAKEKVIDLAGKLAEYTGSMKLYVIPFTKIQMEIIEKCREDELTIIMRRFMMKIAEQIAINEGALSIITGESLGQVASQTLESMYVTNSGISMPVFRPLAGMDKVDIMDISRQIGTYDISILPYEDCCTIFVPKHPKTKPRLNDIEASEQALDKEGLIKEAIEGAEVINVQIGREE
ncbi:tRNA uracil 4-sulfurtransferase ThiI [Fonticella tunisiensis]|uniref:Probable tRNA sulfurtransferase n=1 Tax=Fonticella tunisiensis TaxID=1096341 RepID=A0A4R7KPA5_9CLOT|nr:tRNA uracil 4-sulfurtransferase ThiI [Fonticella tunisiensis]TDT60941.1 thiamine biosynthesis protein ThiI [Fonticella tunisiensis]